MSERPTKYTDTYGKTPEQTRQIRDDRAREATPHLTNLIGQYPITGILEIGSGNGGVTKALQQIYPNTPIIATDSDSNPAIQNAAKDMSTTFLQADATTMDIKSFLTENNLNTIVALRTSGKVALSLLQRLPEIHLPCILITSLLDSSETQQTRQEIAKKAIEMGGRIIRLLEEPYAFDNETGLSVTYEE